MTAKEAAHLQGFGATEIEQYHFDKLADKDLQNLVGNEFSTTVLSAVILGTLLSWDRR
jgi:hypothetical protein